MDGSYVKVADPEVKRKKLCTRPLKCCGICLVTVILLFMICFVTLLGVHSFPPLHASCKIDWTFELPCEEVNNDIVEQMKIWDSADTCGTGQKCLYQMLNATEAEIVGTHETPKAHYIDDLTFKFAQDGDVCKVHGYSTARTWYAVLDKGTNYCNLHNLITGSGLNNITGYNEDTNPNICTQYKSADCEVY